MQHRAILRVAPGSILLLLVSTGSHQWMLSDPGSDLSEIDDFPLKTSSVKRVSVSKMVK